MILNWQKFIWFVHISPIFILLFVGVVLGVLNQIHIFHLSNIAIDFPVASGALFAVSLLCPAFYAEGKGVLGFVALVFGWPSAYQQRSWLANPLLFMSWVIAGWQKGIPSIACSLAALFLGCSFLSAKTIFLDSAGSDRAITGKGYGYWLWLASI